MNEHMEKVLSPIRERRKEIVDSGVSVRDLLKEGTERAKDVATRKMKEVRDAVRI
jgi:tryptophanyl-tRNA synthetase